MATRMALKRLTLEFKSLQENPTPYIEARPSDHDILTWYYLITGPPDTPFEGGQYMGTLVFPANYPYGPPAIRMLTPSGRFEPGARLCLNMSDFHPESWNPAWNVSTILTGLLSFMCSKEVATGALQSTPVRQKEFTKASVKWNLKNPKFNEHFPDIVSEINATVPDPETVETIEVIPPRASELIAQIKSSYRGKAGYETAQHSAKSVMKNAKEEVRANEKASTGDAPGAGITQAQLVGAGLIVLVVAILYFNH